MARQKFFGMRAHPRVCWPGVIVDLRLVPANVHELEVAETLLGDSQGWALGDRNYWSPRLPDELASRGLQLLAPYRSRKQDPGCWSPWLTQKRRRIETVIGQLVERYQARRVWARDLWHFWSRWLRRVLSHVVAVLTCQRQGLSPLRFSQIIVD